MAFIDEVKYSAAALAGEIEQGRSEVASKGRRTVLVSHDAYIALFPQDIQDRSHEMLPAATVKPRRSCYRELLVSRKDGLFTGKLAPTVRRNWPRCRVLRVVPTRTPIKYIVGAQR